MTEYHKDEEGGYVYYKDGERIPNYVCICEAHCSSECCCGAWDVPLPEIGETYENERVVRRLLWSDTHKEEDYTIFDDFFNNIVHNLYEDIRCLKEDITQLKTGGSADD